MPERYRIDVGDIVRILGTNRRGIVDYVEEGRYIVADGRGIACYSRDEIEWYPEDNSDE